MWTSINAFCIWTKRNFTILERRIIMLYIPKERVLEPFNLDEYLRIDQENLDLLEKIDKEAREKGEILHRYITEPYADGKAIYQIIKVNKKTVRIKVCLGIGDEWVLPMFGEECLVDRNYIEESLKRRDFWLNK